MNRRSTAEVKIRFASAGGRNETFRPRPEDAYPQWLFGPCQFRVSEPFRRLAVRDRPPC